MRKVQGNGLVELMDEKPDKDGGFFCMDLVLFLSEEAEERGDAGWEFWHGRFELAKAGHCAYRDKCPRHARTVAKRGKAPVQLTLF